MRPLSAVERRGPICQPTSGARNDVAKTAPAMTASCVFVEPKNVSWKVELHVRMSAKRKRRPRTAKVTSLSTGEGV